MQIIIGNTPNLFGFLERVAAFLIPSLAQKTIVSLMSANLTPQIPNKAGERDLTNNWFDTKLMSLEKTCTRKFADQNFTKLSIFPIFYLWLDGLTGSM